jgi:hypothetical protein
MTSLKFYLPSSNGEDHDAFLEDLWHQGNISYLIYTRRISQRGNPYIKGVLIVDDDNTIPPELECTPIPWIHTSLLVNELKEELSAEQNGVEQGTLSSM